MAPVKPNYIKHKDTVEWSDEALNDEGYVKYHIKRCGRGPFVVYFVERVGKRRRITIKAKDGSNFTDYENRFRIVTSVDA